MATNPLYNTNNTPNNSTQPTKSVNRSGVNITRSHNTFDNSYFHFKTQKFGQYEPFFVMDCTEGDMIPLSVSHDVRSLPFATPFLSSLTLNKDFFMVPHQAIQPNTWELIYKHPNQGDDVPNDAHNVIPASLVGVICNKLISSQNADLMDQYLWYILALENIFSTGSLLFNLGYKINPVVHTTIGEDFSFDHWFDYFVSNMLYYYSAYDDSTNTCYYIDYTGAFDGNVPEDDYTLVQVDNHTFLSLLRRYGSRLRLSSNTESGNFDATVSQLEYIGFDDTVSGFNMDRILAYQLACAQYYVNPQVDFIYNAQLYRDNFISLCKSLDSSFSIDFFTYNGLSVPYDYFSNHYYSKLVPSISSSYSAQNTYDIINYLFGYREQLRFGDYFTDSRTQPLAIGDNNVTVSSDNTVSVIDLNKSLILQRFRNAVVKMGNTYDEYLNKLFGTSPSPDYHIPKYIIHDEAVVKNYEVASTAGDTQGDLVSNLNSHESNKVFEINVDMSCILVGISYFSVPRVYCQTKDKFFFFDDRFDYFNPMLQYLGDQPVNGIELSERNTNSIFGYQSRHGEYKQRYSVASGAFCEKLPAWSFVTDAIYPLTAGFKDLNINKHQSADFIRCYDFEFNRFFKQMSGYSLANSFHFIVVYNNKCVCNRPMEINPNTL